MITTIQYNNKQLFFNIRPELVVNNKVIDIQTLTEIFNENCYQVRPEQLNGSKVVIDLGANIGAFSIMAAAMGASRVYAYEPEPESYKVLVDNIYNNNFETIIIPIQRAIINEATMEANMPATPTDTVEVAMFANSRDSRIEIVNSLESKASKAITGSSVDKLLMVGAITLERVFTGLRECDILKADIEWSEYPIFSNLDKVIMDKIKYLTMEFHGTDSKTFGKMIANLTQSFVVETIGSFERGGFVRARRY